MTPRGGGPGRDRCWVDVDEVEAEAFFECAGRSSDVEVYHARRWVIEGEAQGVRIVERADVEAVLAELVERTEPGAEITVRHAEAWFWEPGGSGTLGTGEAEGPFEDAKAAWTDVLERTSTGEAGRYLDAAPEEVIEAMLGWRPRGRARVETRWRDANRGVWEEAVEIRVAAGPAALREAAGRAGPQSARPVAPEGWAVRYEAAGATTEGARAA